MAAENKALQDKMDREAKSLQEKLKEENEKRSMESKALADRLEQVSRYMLLVSIYHSREFTLLKIKSKMRAYMCTLAMESAGNRNLNFGE